MQQVKINEQSWSVPNGALQSVRYHEPETFLAMVDENVSISLSKHGMRDFVKKWQPESSDTELWAVMESILTMGGGFIRSERGVEFCAPYVFTHFPEELDIYGYGAVIKQNVPLKTDSAITSQTVSNLSYDLVKVEDWRSVADKTNGSATRWIKVRTLNGKTGFVDKQFVRSPTDYSACFLYTLNKGWKMISLIVNEQH